VIRIYEWITSGDAVQMWEGVAIGALIGPALLLLLHLAGAF
jgi:hypothetical protein